MKYVDKNILTWRDINEIERIINKVHYEFPHGIGEEAFGKLVLERFIDCKDDVQEQPEVDLEKEVEKYLLDNADFVIKSTSNEMVNTLARHFYELGLNARKEDN